MVINEMNAAISSLKGIDRQRASDEYRDQLKSLSQFDQRDLDNRLAEAMRTIIGIRKDLDSINREVSK